MTIQERIDKLDLTLFSLIPSQSGDHCRQAFLGLHSAFRQWKKGSFTFLEIGSFKGGSLQSYVADPACTGIISIDPRPPAVPDARGNNLTYPVVTTQDMLDLLAKVPGADIRKVKTIESSTEKMKVSDLPFRPDFCFIDGEHTDEAAIRDARFCLEAMGPDCALAFHDANITYKGLTKILADLEAQKRPFRAYNLADVVFVIELGACRLSGFEPLRTVRDNNYQGFLYCLNANDVYRQTAYEYWRIAEHPIFRLPHKLGLVKLGKKLFGARG